MPSTSEGWLVLADKFLRTPGIEGCERGIGNGHYVAYLCPAKVWTIGWGSTGKDVKKGTVWTKAQCDARLLSDLTTRFGPAVDEMCDGVSLTPGMKAALVSFCYNLGEGRLEESTLLRKLRDGNVRGAADEFLKWHFSGGKSLRGLVRRREAERALFLGIPRP